MRLNGSHLYSEHAKHACGGNVGQVLITNHQRGCRRCASELIEGGAYHCDTRLSQRVSRAALARVAATIGPVFVVAESASNDEAKIVIVDAEDGNRRENPGEFDEALFAAIGKDCMAETEIGTKAFESISEVRRDHGAMSPHQSAVNIPDHRGYTKRPQQCGIERGHAVQMNRG